MTLRTSALVAGLLGVLLLVGGLIADDHRADRDVVASAQVDTPVVVVPPEIVALGPATRIAVDGAGEIEVHVARPVDADAWLSSRTAAFVTGVPEWDTLSTRTAERLEAPSPAPTTEPTASATPSPGATASPAATPSPSASPSASAEPGTSDEQETPAEMAERRGSPDIWRDTWRGRDRVSVAISAIPAGEVVIVESVDGSPLTDVEISFTRNVNDGWITPLIWWGAALTLVGLLALLSRLIDVRPLQRRREERAARRRRLGAEEPREGSRRARRAAGATIPTIELAELDNPEDPTITPGPIVDAQPTESPRDTPPTKEGDQR